MVANTLEDAGHHAFLGPLDGQYCQVRRADLPTRLIDTLEQMAEGTGHG
jgi:hypothetical protein